MYFFLMSFLLGIIQQSIINNRIEIMQYRIINIEHIILIIWYNLQRNTMTDPTQFIVDQTYVHKVLTHEGILGKGRDFLTDR